METNFDTKEHDYVHYVWSIAQSQWVLTPKLWSDFLSYWMCTNGNYLHNRLRIIPTSYVIRGNNQLTLVGPGSNKKIIIKKKDYLGHCCRPKEERRNNRIDLVSRLRQLPTIMNLMIYMLFSLHADCIISVICPMSSRKNMLIWNLNYDRYIKRAGHTGCFWSYPSTLKQQELIWAEKGPRKSNERRYGWSSIEPRSRSPVGMPGTPTRSHVTSGTPNRFSTSSPTSFVASGTFSPNPHNFPF